MHLETARIAGCAPLAVVARLNGARAIPSSPPAAQGGTGGVWQRLVQGGDARNLIRSPNVRTCAQTTREHWMPAVSALLREGDEKWFRRQPNSRIRKPRTAAVSAALTLHIVHDRFHRANHPPPKSSASRTDPPTVRGLKLAELRVVPVIPTPPMAA